MCGIIGYIGGRNAAEVITNGLSKLEYRGYDSAGIATVEKSGLKMVRSVGKLENLKKELLKHKLLSTIGIGHTRWATHGMPLEINAHPQQSGHIVLVHNGIIENFQYLKDELIRKGYKFLSDTDTEVVAHLINSLYTNDLFQAVFKATQLLRGSYALAVISEKEIDKLVVTRRDSPLVIGVTNNGENFAASDIPAALNYTKEFCYLGEGEYAVLKTNSVKFYSPEGKEISKEIVTIDWDPEMAEKGGFEDFMHKEIYEQPRAVSDTLRGKIDIEKGLIYFPELDKVADTLNNLDRILILACGTSWVSGLLGKLYIERFAHVPVEVDIASEFSHRELPLNNRVLVICISQSGETADTKIALRHARKRGAKIASICNVVGSSIANESDSVIYTHAGPEISVASTKAFTSQALTLFLFALWLGERNGVTDREKITEQLSDIARLPEKLAIVLKQDDNIKKIAEKYCNATSFLFLGRHLNYPIAYEGALKLKELSYIHAEGYPAGELKHGPIALLDENFPVMVFAPDSSVSEKLFSNIQEIKARSAKVIAVYSESRIGEKDIADDSIYVPNCPEEISPFLTVMVAQLFAYHCAKVLGKDVDKPRNLAKSVTVE